MLGLHHIYKAICDNPEDDNIRLEYATRIESSDPDRAHFIRVQIRAAHERRNGGFPWPLEGDDAKIYRDNKQRWAADLLTFALRGELDHVSFDRGFPVAITLHPLVFAEYGKLLFELAPLRAVTFCADWDDTFRSSNYTGDKQFPMDAVLRRPEIARLDSIGFVDCFLRSGTRSGVVQLIESGRAERCVAFHLQNSFTNTEAVYRALATSEMRHRVIEYSTPDIASYSIRQCLDDTAQGAIEDQMEFAEAGQALEREFGYMPWLHPEHNRSFLYDVRWHFEHGTLPKYPFGTPPRPEWYAIPPRPIPYHLR